MEKWQRSLYQPNLPLGADGTKVTASKAHITLSKEAAKEGMVLLKNNESLLPFQAGTRLALFGKGSFDYVKGGGGSGDVTVAYTTNLYEGFKKLPEKVEVYEALSDYYRKEVEKQYEAGAEPGMTVEPAFPEETAKKARAYTDTAVICISRFSGEGWDRKSSYDKEMDESVQTDPLLEKAERIFPDGDFYLTKEERTMVEQVQQLFPKVAVVMNAGGMVDTDWFAENEKIQAVLMAWQGARVQHVGINRAVEQPDHRAGQHKAYHADHHTGQAAEQQQLTGAFVGIPALFCAQILAYHHRAAGSQRRKQHDDEVIDHIHQTDAGDGRLAAAGHHHGVGHAHRHFQQLLHQQRDGQYQQFLLAEQRLPPAVQPVFFIAMQ